MTNKQNAIARAEEAFARFRPFTDSHDANHNFGAARAELRAAMAKGMTADQILHLKYMLDCLIDSVRADQPKEGQRAAGSGRPPLPKIRA